MLEFCLHLLLPQEHLHCWPPLFHYYPSIFTQLLSRNAMLLHTFLRSFLVDVIRHAQWKGYWCMPKTWNTSWSKHKHCVKHYWEQWTTGKLSWSDGTQKSKLKTKHLNRKSQKHTLNWIWNQNTQCPLFSVLFLFTFCSVDPLILYHFVSFKNVILLTLMWYPK